ncbi:hypothetical protein PtA15_6A269 [Puccinia triticina]|uniref:DUF7872 domain-containing protein n=1 Tax=Puccinia triticina TaxID=208348 RepID=A0ABY7CK85_9BASI|nr:uncharacterized protein PtA15_6A269 [Puccinia triticina]WAQ85641.1 hypothetical protein PtA15_6A269 [Puccinia triticina]
MDVSYLLSNAQAETQAKLSDATKKVLENGISTDEGIYGVLKGGAFLNNHFSATERSEDEIRSAISAVARARLIAAIWKATKPCTQDGTNGALPGDDVMMNIVQSFKGKLLEHFPSAKLLSAKYNLTTQYFVEHSWDCQQKYGSYNYDPYKKTILPANPDAECIVSLSVCDLTRKDLQKAANKMGALKACRDVGQLPGI